MPDSQRFYNTLHHFERSVVKGKLVTYSHNAIDPRVFKTPALIRPGPSQHPLLQLYGDRDGTVLTSSTTRRVVARPYSYAVVKELEVRESRIRDLFSYTESNLERCGLDGQMTPENLRQMDSLQRACRVADLIGDCVARVVARAAWVDGYNAHLSDWHPPDEPNNCRCKAWDSQLANNLPSGGVMRSRRPQNSMPHPPFTTSSLPSADREKRDRGTVMDKLAHVIREVQLSLIQSLSQWDLIYLSMLTEVAGADYSRAAPDGTESDPDALEKRTAFQECTIRRGASLSLWAVNRKDSDAALEVHKTPLSPSVERISTLIGFKLMMDEMTTWLYKSQANDAVRDVLWELGLWQLGYGSDTVPVSMAFPPVDDPALADLVKAFDMELGDGNDRQKGADEDEEKTMPSMQPGLQMTTVRTLSRKAELKKLPEYEKRFVMSMRPYDRVTEVDVDDE